MKRPLNSNNPPRKGHGKDTMKATLSAILLLSLAASAHSGIVANTIYAESRGESKAGRYAVASVIWSRTSGANFKEICLKRKQFSCWNNGYYEPVVSNPYDAKVMQEAEAWERLMKAERFIPSLKANHYCRTDAFPYWREDLTNTKIIGAHLFGCCN